jgi:hypothetical protein
MVNAARQLGDIGRNPPRLVLDPNTLSMSDWSSLPRQLVTGFQQQKDDGHNN